MERINCTQAYSMLQKSRDIIVLDLRQRGDYLKGHIPGAINLNPYEVASEVRKFIINRHTPIIIYCYSGAVSLGVCLALEDLGYKNIYDLQDIKKWKYKLSS